MTDRATKRRARADVTFVALALVAGVVFLYLGRFLNTASDRASTTRTGVLAIFIGNVLHGEPLTIHGDGAQTRDFVYIDDVVDAWMRVLDAPPASGAVLNVGSGRETSVNELADAVLNAFGESRDTWKVGIAAAQLGDQRRSAAAIESMGRWAGRPKQISRPGSRGLSPGHAREPEASRP